LMVDWSTVCILTAHVPNLTWVHALVVEAGLRGSAVVLLCAFKLLTFSQRISGGAYWTRAKSTMS